MTCFSPIVAYRSSAINASGKRSLQFKPGGSFSGVRIKVPCGKCMGCRLEYSRRWAVRLMHENRMHDNSCFITLTYSPETLPEFGTLVPRDLQLFHKRLHNRLLSERGSGIRYYACGEYGDHNQRPHYHSIVFGYDFTDKVIYSQNSRGEKIFSSKLLDEIWSLGSCKLGSVSFESCAYVARYVTKKVDGPKREDGHYVVYDSEGVVFERIPEFAHMSRRPGIGATYFAKYGKEIETHDSIIMGSKEVPSIRYYDDLIGRADEKSLLMIKRKRARKRQWSELQTDRMRVKEKLLDQRLKMKERKL